MQTIRNLYVKSSIVRYLPSPHFYSEASSGKVAQFQKYDLIGPPNPVSNLRPVRLRVPESETDLHKKLRLLREETQDFNEDFWRRHNESFAVGRAAFVEKILAEKYGDEPLKTTLSAEEMSTFYRDFLDANRQKHVEYNLEWQKRNATILLLSFAVKIESFFTGKN